MAAGAEDPDTTVREDICFLCKDSCHSKDKIKVFGRSSLEISALIARATKVDLSVYVTSDREKAVICNTTCYKRLVKYQNVLRKLDAVVGEIQRDFRGRGLSRGKRLVSEQNRPLDANSKRIKLEDLLYTSSSASPRETLHQAPSTLQIGGKLNSCTEATVHVVYASPNSINTASKAGSSVSTSARPSPILAADNTATKPGISGAFAKPPILAFANGVNTAIRPGICLTTAFTQPPPISATATQPGVSLTTFGSPSPVLARASSVNTTTQPGISLTTFVRPSPILAVRNTTTKPGISAATFTRPSPVLATTYNVKTAVQPGVFLSTFTRPFPVLAASDSVNAATKSGISVTILDRPPISAVTNGVNTATKSGISATTLDRPPISTAANSVNTATKPEISVTTLDRPAISTAANSVNTATKPGISVTALDRLPICVAANSVNTATKPEISVTILDRPPISTAANSVNTTTKPGISVTTLDRPSISTAGNGVNTSSKPGISVSTLDRPPIPATTNSVNTTTKPVTSVFFPDPLVSFTADQLFATLPLQVQKPEQKQEIRIRICVDYPSKPVRKELKSDLHVLARAMVDGNHQRIAGAALKIDGVKELVIEKVIKLMTLQVDELCSKHRPSMLRTTSRNTSDEAKNFDYKKVCSEWKERAPIFHAFLTACAAIKNSKKKNSLECLPGVAVAGTVLLKQRNTQMNAGFAKILGFLIKSKSLEVRSCFLPLFCIFLIGKNGNGIANEMFVHLLILCAIWGRDALLLNSHWLIFTE